MGYMGLNKIGDSDAAWDLSYAMQNAMAKVLEEGLKEEGNEYNTDGIINVALIFEELLVPCIRQYQNNDKLMKVAIKTRDLLKEKIDKDNPKDWAQEKPQVGKLMNWGSSFGRTAHMIAYKRLLKSLNKFIEEV